MSTASTRLSAHVLGSSTAGSWIGARPEALNTTNQAVVDVLQTAARLYACASASWAALSRWGFVGALRLPESATTGPSGCLANTHNKTLVSHRYITTHMYV